MKDKFIITPLKQEEFSKAVDVVMRAKLDTKEEVEHHIKHIEAHLVAKDVEKIVGVVGWYRDNVNYANEAMGDLFPGQDAYWVGFFAVNEKYRGKGVGYKLIAKLEEEVKKLGSSELWVSSVPETKDYYSRQGFKLIKEGKISSKTKYFMKKNI